MTNPVKQRKHKNSLSPKGKHVKEQEEKNQEVKDKNVRKSEQGTLVLKAGRKKLFSLQDLNPVNRPLISENRSKQNVESAKTKMLFNPFLAHNRHQPQIFKTGSKEMTNKSNERKETFSFLDSSTNRNVERIKSSHTKLKEKKFEAQRRERKKIAKQETFEPLISDSFEILNDKNLQNFKGFKSAQSQLKQDFMKGNFFKPTAKDSRSKFHKAKSITGNENVKEDQFQLIPKEQGQKTLLLSLKDRKDKGGKRNGKSRGLFTIRNVKEKPSRTSFTKSMSNNLSNHAFDIISKAKVFANKGSDEMKMIEGPSKFHNINANAFERVGIKRKEFSNVFDLSILQTEGRNANKGSLNRDDPHINIGERSDKKSLTLKSIFSTKGGQNQEELKFRSSRENPGYYRCLTPAGEVGTEICF